MIKSDSNGAPSSDAFETVWNASLNASERVLSDFLHWSHNTSTNASDKPTVNCVCLRLKAVLNEGARWNADKCNKNASICVQSAFSDYMGRSKQFSLSLSLLKANKPPPRIKRPRAFYYVSLRKFSGGPSIWGGLVLHPVHRKFLRLIRSSQVRFHQCIWWLLFIA